MDIGSMRHRITILNAAKVSNENGFEETQLVEVMTVWASIKNLHGKEYFEAARIQKESMVKFVIRYVIGIDETMQIRFRDRLFNIESIDNIRYENRFIEINGMEVDASG